MKSLMDLMPANWRRACGGLWFKCVESAVLCLELAPGLHDCELSRCLAVLHTSYGLFVSFDLGGYWL